MSEAIIQTERLQLYELSDQSQEDIAFVRRLLNEPSFLENIGDRGVRDLEDARAYILKGPMISYRANGFGLYRMQTRQGGQTVGMCGLVNRPALEDMDLGYALLPEFCGHGYAVEAGAAVLADARERLGLERIVAIVDPRNAGSIRVLEKLDFRFEKMVQLTPDDVTLKLFASGPPR
ncbi:GNAT family N-acetyltransferase [Pseudoxanthomonas sacheonensis]|uniref:GNAT family N-acetyltransferase n=1 Tax=Pseudoxanthomonas sacheonensis TaxID=443615 RepID=UPI0013D33A56|nr:GNAT family N-acetyltransferase [Pseudoxanthomonas sacheonensis]KAF1707178.1 GNAT family N-acetyltransferase [Pseudoxanthomonas sacheonensis]